MALLPPDERAVKAHGVAPPARLMLEAYSDKNKGNAFAKLQAFIKEALEDFEQLRDEAPVGTAVEAEEPQLFWYNLNGFNWEKRPGVPRGTRPIPVPIITKR